MARPRAPRRLSLALAWLAIALAAFVGAVAFDHSGLALVGSVATLGAVVSVQRYPASRG